MNKTKGFTLIELLVVIAIIGILSSVVLASLNTARGKGANAAVKSNLSNLRAQAELFYDSQTPSTTYAGMCASTNVDLQLDAADAAGGGTNKCFGDATTYVASTLLKVAEGTNTHYCVDSTGKSKAITTAQFNALAAGSTCP